MKWIAARSSASTKLWPCRTSQRGLFATSAARLLRLGDHDNDVPLTYLQSTIECSYSIATLRSVLKSVNILPVPRTTLAKGSSAMDTGSPVSSRIR